LYFKIEKVRYFAGKGSQAKGSAGPEQGKQPGRLRRGGLCAGRSPLDLKGELGKYAADFLFKAPQGVCNG
jgi:hypothetical protein